MKWYSKLGIAIAIGVNIAVSAGIYYAFDKSMDRLANESIDNWRQAESNNLLEGNLLTSVARNQKLLLSSEFLKGVTVFEEQGSRIDISLSFGSPVKVDVAQLQDGVVSYGWLKKIAIRQVSKSPNQFVAFVIYSNAVSRFFWICIVSLFVAINGAFGMIAALQRYEYLKRERHRDSFTAKAAQAVHDVQSPLMTLSHLVADKRLVPEVRQSLSLVVKNISAILNELNEDRRANSECLTEIMNSSVKRTSLNSVISKDAVVQILGPRLQTIEDRISCSIEDFADESFSVPMSQVEFSRCISNFIENSVEALGEIGNLKITLRKSASSSLVEISDSGVGIPEDKIAQLGQPGVTWGKPGGSGMGFYSSKRIVESVGGTVRIQSSESAGTKITLEFPQRTPSTTIGIEEDEHLYFLDDNETALDAIKMLVARDVPKYEGRVHYFTRPDQLLGFTQKKPHQRAVAVCDFDIKSELDGLEVIQLLPKNCRPMLLTGHANDKEVRQRANALGVHLLSKSSFDQLQIEVLKQG